MEELREAARGYYNHGSQYLQDSVLEFFRSLDTNRDGRVSLHEFVDFLSWQGHAWMQPNLFTQLDQNGDGSLDFWEVITLYYIIKTRNVFCRTCHTNLLGLYFTCTTCFDHDVNSFDLCLRCYQSNLFHHHHDRFLDSYLLLRSRREPTTAIAAAFGNLQPNNNAQALVPYQPQALVPYQPQALVPYQPQPLVPHQPQPHQRMNWLHALHALEAVIAIGSWAGVLCSIM